MVNFARCAYDRCCILPHGKNTREKNNRRSSQNVPGSGPRATNLKRRINYVSKNAAKPGALSHGHQIDRVDEKTSGIDSPHLQDEAERVGVVGDGIRVGRTERH